MKVLSTIWLGRSRRKFRSNLGENWVDDSCSATTVSPRTSAMTVMTEVVMLLSRVRASSAVPWNASGANGEPGLTSIWETANPASSATRALAPGQYPQRTGRVLADSCPSDHGVAPHLNLRRRYDRMMVAAGPTERTDSRRHTAMVIAVCPPTNTTDQAPPVTVSMRPPRGGGACRPLARRSATEPVARIVRRGPEPDRSLAQPPGTDRRCHRVHSRFPAAGVADAWRSPLKLTL